MRVRFTLCAVLLASAGLSLGGGKAFGYAGEQGTSPALAVSTHHLHLTRALAYCAGLEGRPDIPNPVDPVISPGDARPAEVIAIYDELTDQGTIPASWGSWTNITTPWTYTDKTASEFASCTGGTTMLFPVLASSAPQPLPDAAFWNPNIGWFTNRFGPWAANFHFPTTDDLTRMKSFAMTTGQTLSARTVYAFGAGTANMWTADCYPEPYLYNLSTGEMISGSEAALGTYLHSLGDSFSHGVCRDHWTSSHKPPWYYHTPATENLQEDGCAFNSHSLEFGCPRLPQQVAFQRNVVSGGIEVFKALVEYAQSKSKSQRLQSAEAHQRWLYRQLERYAMLFKTNTNAQGGACRVSFTWELMKACNQIPADTAACVPDIAVTCDTGGQDLPCEPDPSFTLTPACTSSTKTTATR